MIIALLLLSQPHISNLALLFQFIFITVDFEWASILLGKAQAGRRSGDAPPIGGSSGQQYACCHPVCGGRPNRGYLHAKRSDRCVGPRTSWRTVIGNGQIQCQTTVRGFFDGMPHSIPGVWIWPYSVRCARRRCRGQDCH